MAQPAITAQTARNSHRPNAGRADTRLLQKFTDDELGGEGLVERVSLWVLKYMAFDCFSTGRIEKPEVYSKYVRGSHPRRRQ